MIMARMIPRVFQIFRLRLFFTTKQLVGRTYDFARPGVIAIYLTGCPRPGVGPHDVALSICGAVYKNGYVKSNSNVILWVLRKSDSAFPMAGIQEWKCSEGVLGSCWKRYSHARNNKQETRSSRIF